MRRQSQRRCASITGMIRQYAAGRAKVISDHPHNAAVGALGGEASGAGQVAAGKGVGAAEGVGQPVAPSHVANQLGGVLAGHPGGGDM